jgi:hypothetical protein
MKKVKVIFDFLRLAIAGKVAKARSIITEMTKNPNFAAPDVSLDAMKELTDLLESHNLAAQNGGKTETKLMHQTEAQWDDMMRKMARYVERVANNDAAIILSAGFNLSKQPVPAQRPELSAESGIKSGSVFLRRNAVQGAKSYLWQYSMTILPDSDSGWTFAKATSKASVEIDDLVPVNKYWFRVAAVTAQGTSSYNDPVMHYIL